MANLDHIYTSLLSDKGQVHPHNEDFILARKPKNEQDEAKNGWVFTVADGVGGADAGEIASQYASEKVHHHFFSNATERDWGKRMVAAFHAANKDLRMLAANRNKNSRMATTMVAVIVHDYMATYTNVGDSRGYHWRDGKLKQITKDHSLVAKLLEEGVITPEQAVDYPRPNVILYSLGSEHEPQIDLFSVDLLAGDIIFLCSDGLTRHVKDDEIAELLSEPVASIAAKKLVDLANERGGQDNISVAVIQFRPNDDTATVGHSLEFNPITDGSTTTFLWFFTGILSFLQSAYMSYIWFKLFT